MFLSSRGSRGISSIFSDVFRLLDRGAEPRCFFATHVAHGRVGVVLHFARRGQLAFERQEGAEFFGDRRQPGIFHRQIAELALSADDGRIGQRAADFLVAVDHFFETQSNRVFHANHCKGLGSSYSALHATKARLCADFTGPGRAVARGFRRPVHDQLGQRRPGARRHGVVARRLPRRHRSLSQGRARHQRCEDFRACEQGRGGMPADQRQRQDRAPLAEARAGSRRGGGGRGARGRAALSTRGSRRCHPAYPRARR